MTTPRNCTPSSALNNLTAQSFTLLDGDIYPRVSGQRFWWLTDNIDANKACLFNTADTGRDISDAKLIPQTSTSALNHPAGAVIRVARPSEAIEADDLEQWPHYNSDQYEGYLYDKETLSAYFHEQPVTSQAQPLFSLNVFQAHSAALYNTLTRLHPNGSFKFFDEDDFFMLADIFTRRNDLTSLFLLSDEMFLIGNRPSHFSHGNITRSITQGDTIFIDPVKLKVAADFFFWKFNLTQV